MCSLCIFCFEWKPIWVLDNFRRQINIEFRPVKVAWNRLLNFEYGLYGRIVGCAPCTAAIPSGAAAGSARPTTGRMSKGLTIMNTMVLRGLCASVSSV